MFGEEDARFLRRAAVHCKWTLVIGILMMGLGMAYAVFGVFQADPQRTPHPGATFDAPIARLANLSGPRLAPLPAVEAEDERERALLAALNRHRDMNGRVLVLLLRVMISSMVLGMGLVAVAIAVTQKRFLAVIANMQPDIAPGAA